MVIRKCLKGLRKCVNFILSRTANREDVEFQGEEIEKWRYSLKGKTSARKPVRVSVCQIWRNTELVINIIRVLLLACIMWRTPKLWPLWKCRTCFFFSDFLVSMSYILLTCDVPVEIYRSMIYLWKHNFVHCRSPMDVKTQIFLHSLYMYGETSETHITKILLSKSKVRECAVRGNGCEVGNWLRSRVCQCYGPSWRY